jgi:hypothetical protein
MAALAGVVGFGTILTLSGLFFLLRMLASNGAE